MCLRPPNCRLGFPQSCGDPAVRSHWPSGSGSLGTPSPSAGSPGSEPPQQRGSFSGAVGLQLWVSPSAGAGLDFTVSAPLLPSLCGFLVSSDVSTFFGGFQRPPVYGCGLGALAGGDECTFFYSAVLNLESDLVFQKDRLSPLPAAVQVPLFMLRLLSTFSPKYIGFPQSFFLPKAD